MIKCPNCGSDYVEPERTPEFNGYRCFNCGKWSYECDMIEVGEKHSSDCLNRGEVE